MTLLKLASLSLLSRRLTVALTVLAMALSVALFLSVEKLRSGARSSFADTISDTDLIIGARSGGVQLLLYSVFRIGNATNNMRMSSYQEIAARPEVDWAVPISLGDSHRQFRVMGTTPEYFERYKYRGGRGLAFAKGVVMDDLFDAVIGADVAQALGYDVGDPIVVSHGISSFSDHDNTPFQVAGVLAKTGTPVDRTVIVSLRGIEAIHVDWQNGGASGRVTPAQQLRRMDLRPKAITAAMIGVKSRLQIFGLQRDINEFSGEPLLAILPGLALQELWQIVGIAETALVGVSVAVVVTALIGMLALILAGLNERRREMAILRAVGAGPRTVLVLLLLEAFVMVVGAAILGVLIHYGAMVALQPMLDSAFGLFIPVTFLGAAELQVLGLIILAGTGISLFPAWRAYRISLADGMTVRF